MLTQPFLYKIQGLETICKLHKLYSCSQDNDKKLWIF
jgi:hypothetical protein